MRPIRIDVREVLLGGWRRTIHLWRPMAAWTAIVWVTAALLLGPLSSALLGRHLLRGDPVRGNVELLAWILTPLGLIYALLVVALGMTAATIRYAGLFHIVTADLEGRSPAVPKIAVRLGRQIPDLLRACLGVTAAILVALGVLVAGLGGIYAALLSEFDINYYVTVRPGAWWISLALAAIWTVTWATVVVFVLGRTILALPAYLDGYRPGREALRRAWRRTRTGVVPLLGAILGSAAAWLLTRVAADALYLRAGASVIEELGVASLSLRPLALVTAGLVVGSFVLDAIIGFLGFSFVATVLTKCYGEGTDLHAAAPPVPSLEDLGARVLATFRPWLRASRLVPLGTLSLFGSLALSGWLLERTPEVRPAAVTAHRAGPSPAPENTLAALELSIQAGADFAEIDVQRTRDDVVVVVHDVDLMRTAGVPLRIGEAEYADLATVIQGREGRSPAAERRVATLGEFLERARGRIGLVVELKYHGWDPALAERAVGVIRSAGMEDEVIVMSLNLEAIRQVRRIAPEVRVAYASAVAVGDVSRLSVDLLAVARNRATRSLIRAAHRRHMEVHVWTLNEARHMVSAIERGADGVITDRPELAVRVNRELAELPAAFRLLLRFQRVVVQEEGEEADPPIL